MLLLAAILSELGYTTWVLSRGARVEDRGIVQAPTHRSKPFDPSVLVNAHLFGTAEAPITASEDAPDSHSDLILSATFATADSRSGYAIIASNSKGPKLYSVGGADAVATGVDLIEVYADRVIMRRAGTAETLWLSRRTASAKTARAHPAAVLNPDDDKKRFGNAIKLEKGAFDPEMPAAPYPTRLITQLRVMPVLMDNHLFGYSVDPKVSGAIKGLPPNAVVTKINGVLLDAGPTAQRMFESLTSAGTATLSVRDGDSDSDVVVDVSGLPAAVAPGKKPAGI